MEDIIKNISRAEVVKLKDEISSHKDRWLVRL